MCDGQPFQFKGEDVAQSIFSFHVLLIILKLLRVKINTVCHTYTVLVLKAHVPFSRHW